MLWDGSEHQLARIRCQAGGHDTAVVPDGAILCQVCLEDIRMKSRFAREHLPGCHDHGSRHIALTGGSDALVVK